MKLHNELTARTILRRQPRTHHYRFIHPALAHLSTPRSLNNPTTSAATNAVGRVPELLMTEQTHSAHARPCRIPRPPTVAMPEVGIGFIPDVGGTYLLARAPGRTGLRTGLTGAPFTGADAIVLGFADHFVPQGELGDLAAAVVAAGVDAAIAAYAVQPPASDLAQQLWIDECYAHHLLSVYFGHFGDLLFNTVGFPSTLAAVTENQFPTTMTILETGEKVPYTSANEVMVVIGTLNGAGLFSIQLEGGQSHKTGLQIDLTGVDGALRVVNARAFENEDDNTLYGFTGSTERYVPLEIPAEYQSLPKNDLAASVHDVAYLYDTSARDRRDGLSTVSDFNDAVRQHQLIDQINQSSAAILA